MMNCVLLSPLTKKTSYELWHARKPNIDYFKVFKCKCFILNNKDLLNKFDSTADEGIFLGYLITSKAYKVYNKRISIVEESEHVTSDESNHFNHVHMMMRMLPLKLQKLIKV